MGARIVLSLIPLLFLVSAAAADPTHQARVARRASAGDVQTTAPYREGEVLVRFRTSASGVTRRAAHGARGGRVRERFATVSDLERVELPPGSSVEDAVRAYETDASVAYAEPNYLIEAFAIPNDPRFPELWGLHNTGQSKGLIDADIDAVEAWDITTGSSDVIVAVIDTGMDYDHTELASNMFRNTPECVKNGADDDLNGWIDDCHGINTYRTSDNGNPTEGSDDHATHVAGTIGARGNNAILVAGVNWDVRILACKFLDRGNGSTSDALQCLDYIADMKDRGHNIVATNNSWGSSAFSQALLDAIDAQRERGILFIASAGNSGAEGSTAFPASYYLPNVISVAATTRTDSLATFSNFGVTAAHLGAPGVQILSTTPGGSFQVFNGTSMAAPHVTGVVALLAAQDPGRDWKALRNLVLSSGDDIASLESKTITGKRLNAHGALTCSGSEVSSRLRPIGKVAFTAVDQPIGLAALHIDCAEPAGDVVVDVEPGGLSIVLTDDGTGFDQEPGDGVYSAEWTAPSPGEFILRFPNDDDVSLQVGPDALVSGDPHQGDFFGHSMAADSGRLVVGEPFDSLGALDAGAAHLIDAATGVVLHRFAKPSPNPFEYFGWSVALQGDLVAVGAPFESEVMDEAGAVYVFNAQTGALLNAIPNPDPVESGWFGRSVAFAAGYLLVGAPGSDVQGDASGVVHFYDPLAGTLLHTFLNPAVEEREGDAFGWSVATSGTRAVVGAPGFTNNLLGLGQAYVLDADPNSPGFGSLLAELYANPPFVAPPRPLNLSFGIVVATIGDDFLVSDWQAFIGDHGNWKGPGAGSSSGIAYRFDGTTGAHEATFLPPFPGTLDRFGYSIAGLGDYVLVGMTGEDLAGVATGAAYLFEADTGQPVHVYLSPAPSVGDLNGSSVAIIGDHVFSGAPRADTLGPDSGIVHRASLPSRLDRFRCYQTLLPRGSVRPPDQELLLSDEFESKRTIVRTAVRACNPATQNGSVLNDAGAYLTCHGIKDVKGQAKFAGRELHAVGTLGGEHLTLKKAAELCVVSGRSGGPPAATLDAYKCYQAAVSKGSLKFLKRSLLIQDEIESKRSTVIKPVSFCNAVSVDGGNVNAPDRHLICYMAIDDKGQALFPAPTLEVSSLLGDQTLATKKLNSFCVPAGLAPSS